MNFTCEFCQTFKEESTPVFLKLFQKLEEGSLLGLFCGAVLPMIPKQHKDMT
jgi:hypothetical protein